MLDLSLINPVTGNPFPFAVVRDRKVFAVEDHEAFKIHVRMRTNALYRITTSRTSWVELVVAVNGYDALAPTMKPATLESSGILLNGDEFEMVGFQNGAEGEDLSFRGHPLPRGTRELFGVVWAAIFAGNTHAGDPLPAPALARKELPWTRIQPASSLSCAVEFDSMDRLNERGIVIPRINDFWPFPG